MLILKRSRGERVYLYVTDPASGNVTRIVVEVTAKLRECLKLGFHAPENVVIAREELVDTDKRLPPTPLTS